MSAYPNTSSKADLAEAHREKMKLKKAKRATLTPTHRGRHDGPGRMRQIKGEWGPPERLNFLPAYRKSIWPADKFANKGRMA